MDTLPDIFAKNSQGSAVTKRSFKNKQKKCGKTIEDILGSPDPFEEKTEKKRKNKKTVDKFQEDVKKDFDRVSISDSHTPVNKVHESVSESTNPFVTQESDQKIKEVVDDKKNKILDELPKTTVELRVETQTPEDPQYTQPKTRSCLKDKTNGKVAKSTKHVQFTVVQNLFIDVLGFPEVIEEQIDIFEEDMTRHGYHENVEALPEEDEEHRSVCSEDDYTPFSEEYEISFEDEITPITSLQEAETNVSLQEIHDDVIEEQIDDVIEEQIDDVIEDQIDFFEEDMTRYGYHETVEALPEEDEEHRSVCSEDDYTPFTKESEICVQEDEEMLLRASLQKALEEVDELTTALEKSLQREDETNICLQEALQREDEINASLEEALEREARTKASLEEALEKVEETNAASQEALEREARTKASLQEAMDKVEETNTSLQEALEREARIKASLQEALEREARTKASLKKALKKEKAQQEEILEQELKEKALENALKNAEAEKDDLRAVIDSMKAQVADLMKSQMSFEETHKMQRHTITAMTAELDESKKLIIKLQKDLEASNFQHEKEMAEHLIQQQEKNLEKDNEIQSLNVKLQMATEAKDNIVSTLQEKAEQSASDLKEEERKNSELKRKYEAILSQQKHDEKQHHLIQENQKLISENKRLQNELQSALNKRHLLQKEPQEDGEDCGRLEEAIQGEKAQFLQKIQMQKEELAEKTLALEKSLTAEKYLRSSLRKEKKRFDQMLFQKQTAEPDAFLKNQLREASANLERLTYDMQTLRMENVDIRGKFSATEEEFDKLKSKYTSLSERHQEMMSEKNETISENERTITKLECKLQKLKWRFQDIINKERTKNSELEQKVDQISSALEKERTTCEKQRVELMEASRFEDIINKERTKNSELEEKVYQISSALEKERTTSEKQRIELMDVSTKQMTTLEEKRKLSVALQKAQEQLSQSSNQSRYNSNFDFMLNQQRIALDKTTAALIHLQKQNSDVTFNHQELLKTHNALKLRYENLLYAQGNLRAQFSPLRNLTQC